MRRTSLIPRRTEEDRGGQGGGATLETLSPTEARTQVTAQVSMLQEVSWRILALSPWSTVTAAFDLTFRPPVMQFYGCLLENEGEKWHGKRSRDVGKRRTETRTRRRKGSKRSWKRNWKSDRRKRQCYWLPKIKLKRILGKIIRSMKSIRQSVKYNLQRITERNHPLTTQERPR